MAREPLLSASDLAVAEIRELIESGRLRPGQRISADQLAETLQISRTPIFDALHRLKVEGVVDVFPRRGAYVREISRQEVNDVYALKIANEPLAAEWAAQRGSEGDRRKLQDLLCQFRISVERNEVRPSSRYVDDIHTLLFEMAHSEPLLAVYRAFHARVKVLRHLNMAQPGRLEVSLQQHTQIVENVLSGSGGEARQAMLSHMKDAAESVSKLLNESNWPPTSVAS